MSDRQVMVLLIGAAVIGVVFGVLNVIPEIGASCGY